MTDDIRKLLGGYATGTLTEEERQALFAAALDDQALFEALASEHALQELLDDGAARAQLLQATQTARFSMRGILHEWFDRPKAKVLVGVGVALLLVIGVRDLAERAQVKEEPQTVAVLRQTPPIPRHQEPAADSAAAPAEAPTPRAKRMAETRPLKSVPAPAPHPAAPAALADQVRRPAIAAQAPAREATEQTSNKVAADTTTRIATAGQLEMKYTVLLRNEKGEYLPVPAEYAFSAGDQARVRVELNREGIVALTGPDGKPMYVRNVMPATPVTVPYDITFEQASSQQVELAFMPTTALPQTPSAMTFRAEEARAKASPRTSTMVASGPPPPSLAVRIELRRKP